MPKAITVIPNTATVIPNSMNIHGKNPIRNDNTSVAIQPLLDFSFDIYVLRSSIPYGTISLQKKV